MPFNRAPEYEALQYYSARYTALATEIGSSQGDHEVFKALAADIYRTGQAHGELPAEDEYSNADFVRELRGGQPTVVDGTAIAVGAPPRAPSALIVFNQVGHHIKTQHWGRKNYQVIQANLLVTCSGSENLPEALGIQRLAVGLDE